MLRLFEAKTEFKSAREIPSPKKSISKLISELVVDGVRVGKLDDTKFKFLIIGYKFAQVASTEVVNDLLNRGEWPSHLDKLVSSTFKEYPKYLEFELNNPTSSYKPAQHLREWITYLICYKQIDPTSVQGYLDFALNIYHNEKIKGNHFSFCDLLDELLKQVLETQLGGIPAPRPVPLHGTPESKVVEPSTSSYSLGK